jgi:oxygen-independent coproporphyrinogen III oxidase
MAMLYVHIPFCERKCIYCDFYSTESFELYEQFLDALLKEIETRSRLHKYSSEFSSVFFGGGTPSLLTGPQMARILETLKTLFPIADDAEISMEANPGTVTLESLRSYRLSGVNRMSFGVQSFHDDDLVFLSRIHSAAEARQGILLAREAGFDNINLDLMFSLPGQTTDRWRYNLEQARELGTTHLSCYSLTVEQGTALATMVDNGEVLMPEQESDAELFDASMDTLAEWGFRQYEVSNYALAGYECRHNLGYWKLDDYLGFGPSAHSTWEEQRQWNVSSLKAYVQAVEKDGTAFAGGEQLDIEKRRKEFVYLGLRSEGLILKDYEQRFESDFLSEHKESIQNYVSRSFISVDDGVLRLTREGMQFADEICLNFV